MTSLSGNGLEKEYAALERFVFPSSPSDGMRELAVLLGVPLSEELITHWASNRENLIEYFDRYYSFFLTEGRSAHTHDLANSKENVEEISLRYAIALKKAHYAHALANLIRQAKDEDNASIQAAISSEPAAGSLPADMIQAWEAINMKQTQVNDALIAQIKTLSQEFAEISASVSSLRDQLAQRDWEMTAIKGQVDRMETDMKHWREKIDDTSQAVKLQVDEHGRMLQNLHSQSPNP